MIRNSGIDLKDTDASTWIDRLKEFKNYWISKREYYRVFQFCHTDNSKIIAPPGIPEAISEALSKFFWSYFFYSQYVYTAKIAEPLVIICAQSYTAFQRDLEALYPYKSKTICLLVDPNFQGNVDFFIKVYKTLDIKGTVNILQTKYGLSLGADQVNDIAKKLKIYLEKYAQLLQILKDHESLLTKVADENNYNKEQMYTLKLKTLESLLILVKTYVVTELKNKEFTRLILTDLETTRAYLKNKTFATGTDAKLHGPGFLKLARKHYEISTKTTQISEDKSEEKNQIESLEQTQDFAPACKNGDLARAKALSKNISEEALANALYTACADGQVKIIKFLLNKISSIRGAEKRLLNRFYTEKERTPLMAALEKNHIDVVNFLLKSKVIDPAIKNRFGESALSFSNDEIRKKISSKITTTPKHKDPAQIPMAVSISRPFTPTEELKIDSEKIKKYFKSVNIPEKLVEIKTLLISLKPYTEIISDFKWLQTFSELQEKFVNYEERFNRLKEELSTITDSSNLQKIKKQHIKITKQLEYIKEQLLTLGRELNFTGISLSSEESKLSPPPSIRYSSIFSSPSSRSLGTHSYSVPKPAEALTREAQEKDYTNFRFFLPPQPPKLSDYFEIINMLDSVCYRKLEKIIFFRDFSAIQQDKSKINVFKAIQTDAILFEIMQFMEQQAHLTEPNLIRQAIVHFKGSHKQFELQFHSSVLEEKNITDLHNKVMSFATDLLSLDINRLRRNSLYKKLIAHGELLQQEKEVVALSERRTFNTIFNTKKFWYESFNYEFPFIEPMFKSALEMINIHYHIYGTPNNPQVDPRRAVTSRHKGPSGIASPTSNPAITFS